jgi:ferredoxin
VIDRLPTEAVMPKIQVEGGGSFEVPAGKRLVNALVDDCGVDQLHACGGVARCTTCRVEFVSGEPAAMTRAEKDVLAAKGLAGTPGLRLSCQIACDGDMTVRCVSRLEGSGRKDRGHRPADALEPPPEWT